MVSHISHVVILDSGGEPTPRSMVDATEKRDFGGVSGAGAGEGEREGTCFTVTASYMGILTENSM